MEYKQAEGGRDGSYQLNVKLSDHLDLQVDDVSVTGVSAEKEAQRDHQDPSYLPLTFHIHQTALIV